MTNEAELKPREVKPREVKRSEVKRSEVKPREVKPREVPRPVAKQTPDTEQPSPIPPAEYEQKSELASSSGLSKRSRQATLPPPSLDALEERYAALTSGGNTFSSEEAIDRQITSLEDWTRLNLRRERLDLTRFWVLRCTAFAGAIIAGTASFLPSTPPLLALCSGGVTVVALAIDAAWPPSADRVTRRRAIRELREAQQTLKLKWDKVRLAHPEKYSPRRIAHALALLDAAQAKREEIGKYLSDASPTVRGGVGG